jgi:gamma-glutamyl AIG2-like cyclotransferase
MANPLFVYGTLCDPDLLAGILARRLAGDAALPAAAPGFRAVHYPGRAYPALLRAAGAAAPGLALMDLTPFECDLLDAYEGEEYRRQLIPVMIADELHEADAYLPVAVMPADAEPWTLSAWQATHKPRALGAERAAVDLLRQKLIAIRPH